MELSREVEVGAEFVLGGIKVASSLSKDCFHDVQGDLRSWAEPGERQAPLPPCVVLLHDFLRIRWPYCREASIFSPWLVPGEESSLFEQSTSRLHETDSGGDADLCPPGFTPADFFSSGLDRSCVLREQFVFTVTSSVAGHAQICRSRFPSQLARVVILFPTRGGSSGVYSRWSSVRRALAAGI